MLDATATSFAAHVASRTGKIIKNGLRIFERAENFLQNGILHFVFKVKPIVRNRVAKKLEFTQAKNGLF